MGVPPKTGRLTIYGGVWGGGGESWQVCLLHICVVEVEGRVKWKSGVGGGGLSWERKLEPPHNKTNKMIFAPSLIRVRSMGNWGPKVSSCGQRRLISPGRCPGWSEYSLGAQTILLVLSWGGSLRFSPGAVARSEASSLGMQAAPSLIPTSSTFFRGDLVMKTFLRPFSLFRWFKKSSCHLLAKECALSTGKLPRRLAQEQCC